MGRAGAEVAQGGAAAASSPAPHATTAHAHAPATHVWPPAQPRPHALQLALVVSATSHLPLAVGCSRRSSRCTRAPCRRRQVHAACPWAVTQRRPRRRSSRRCSAGRCVARHRACPGAQGAGLHAPLAQRSPSAQRRPQAPQERGEAQVGLVAARGRVAVAVGEAGLQRSAQAPAWMPAEALAPGTQGVSVARVLVGAADAPGVVGVGTRHRARRADACGRYSPSAVHALPSTCSRAR